MKIWPVLLVVVFLTPVYAQMAKGVATSAGNSSPASNSDASSLDSSSSDTKEEVPEIKLDFKAKYPIAGVTASPVMLLPFHCSSQGAVFLRMLLPPEFREQVVVSIDAKRATLFSVTSITDVTQIRLSGTFPSDSGLAMLIYATKPDGGRSRPILSKDGAPLGTVASGESRYYIAKFDKDGNYRGSIPIPATYDVFSFASLASGEYLVAGYDKINSVARLSLITPAGDPIRNIDMPFLFHDSASSAETEKEEPGNLQPSKASLLASRIRFSIAGDSVLVWQSGTASPILEIGRGGSVREIPLQYPKGYLLQDFISTSDRWIAEFYRSGLPEGDGIDNRPSTGNVVLYEFRSSDGSILRKLARDDSQPGWIACEHDGGLIAYKTDDKLNLIPLIAELGK